MAIYVEQGAHGNPEINGAGTVTAGPSVFGPVEVACLRHAGCCHEQCHTMPDHAGESVEGATAAA